MKTRIKAEWDQLRQVMIHKPGIEITFGLLEPETFLYERYFNHKRALEEYESLENALSNEGVKVHQLKDVIINKVEANKELKNKLSKSALECIKFSGKKGDTNRAWRRLEESIENGTIDPEQLFDLLLLNPTVRLNVERPEVICDEPLANLVFVRDQQAVTDKGVVFGRAKLHQRRREVMLTRLALEALEAEIVFQVEPTGTFEGGDFLPMKEFALIGMEPRTNEEGIKQILSKAVEFDEIGVVSQPKHPLMPEPDPQVSMHLDTYFNVASDNVAVGYKPLLENAAVRIFRRTAKGEYVEQEENPSLFQYVSNKGFNVVDISTLEQLCYASNFLCIKNARILAVDVKRNVKYRLDGLREKVKEDPEKYTKLYEKARSDYARLKGTLFPDKKELPDYGIEVVPVALPNITGGYGSIHCMTCTLSRD